jgi:hypothetical protein
MKQISVGHSNRGQHNRKDQEYPSSQFSWKCGQMPFSTWLFPLSTPSVSYFVGIMADKGGIMSNIGNNSEHFQSLVIPHISY